MLATAMLGLQHETPSRILRRIQANEDDDDDMPSLPSLENSLNDSGVKNDPSSSLVVRRRPRPVFNGTTTAGTRGILSPLNTNKNRAANTPGETRESPAANDKGKGKSVESPRSQQQRRRPAPSTVASTASSTRTVRPVFSSSSPKKASRRASSSGKKDDSLSNNDTSAREQEQSSAALNLDDSILSPNAQEQRQIQDDSSLHGLHLDSSTSMDLRQLEDSVNHQPGSTPVVGHEEEQQDYPTPVPPTSARFQNTGRPSTITEEQEEEEEEIEGQEEASSSLPALPSPASSVAASPAANVGDTSAQRIGQHVVLRRRTNPIVRRANLHLDSPDSALSARPHHQPQRQESTIGSTPGIGRRLPSAERRGHSTYPEISVSYVDDNETPSKPNNNDSTSVPPSTAISSRAYSPSIHNFATPRAAGSDADLERRKSHLLSTLRLTALRSGNAKPRLKKGTPHPAQQQRRARSLTPALHDSILHNGDIDEQEEEGEHTASSSISASSSAGGASTSSHDLTTHPRGTGNTSLPLTGAGTMSSIGVTAAGAIGGKNRFNGAKLNNYLHTLNTHLSSENQNLVKTLEETAKEVQRLMAKNRELVGSRRDGNDDVGDASEMVGDVTREMLAGHQKTRDDIEQLREHLTGSTPLKSAHGRKDNEAEHARQLRDLQDQLKERDINIASLREQLLARETPAGEDTTNSHLIPELQQQIFTLQDQLTTSRSEIATKDSELVRLRQDLLDSAQRNTSAISDLQNRTDELLLSLEERDEQLDEAERRLEIQDEEFKEKMKGLEMELCKVMEEQEGQLRDAQRELEDLKDAQKITQQDKEEAKAGLQKAEKEIDDLRKEKERLENLLDETTSTLSNGEDKESTVLRERISLLQDQVHKQQRVIEESERTLQISREEASQAARDSANQIRHLKDKINELDNRAKQAERKLSNQAIALTETESSLEEAESNLRNAEKQVSRLEKQLTEAQSTISTLQREQVNTSFAVLESDLQKKLEAAQRELGNLKHQLASPSSILSNKQQKNAVTAAESDVKDLEIRTLRSSNHELETRVNQLKKQAMVYNNNNKATGGKGNNSVSMLQTPLRNGNGMATPEKSVRFDSVKSMKTPKSVSEMLNGLSFLDKTDANATIAPLYHEIDNLHEQVKHYQDLLQSANEDVDDKLKKLNRAGVGTVDLAKELEGSRRRVKELERELERASGGGAREVERLSEKLRQTEADLRATRQQLSRAGSSDNQAIISELRGVRDQLTNERSDLLKRLTDIKQHCNQISSQLDASRTSQAGTQRSLEAQVQETRKLRQALSQSEGAFSQLDTQREALVQERNTILQGVAALQRDLNKVQKEAVELGDDIRSAREGEAVAIKAPFGSGTCTKQACVDQQLRSREEAKGLLVMIKYLKLKFTRESYLRADLAHQKLYLNMVISQKQRIMDATNSTLARFGMPPSPEKRSSRPTLKIVANAVLSVVRMQRMSEEWKRQSAIKGSLREAYKQTRGKEFPN